MLKDGDFFSMKKIFPVIQADRGWVIKDCPFHDRIRHCNFPNACRVSNFLDKEIRDRSCPYNTFTQPTQKQIEAYAVGESNIDRYQMCDIPKEEFQESLF